MKTKNKSFKRLFAFLVALVMVTALVPSVIFAADPTFKDVPTTHWAYDYIEKLAKADVIGGYADGTFRPTNNVTRQQAAKMIAKAAGLEASADFVSKFTDIDKVASELKPYVLAVEERQVVGGFPDGSFGPLKNITRAQVAKMIVLAFGLEKGPKEVKFDDPVADATDQSYIDILASWNIVGGYKEDGKQLYKPANLLTREQLAKILVTAMELEPAVEIVSVSAINAKTVEVTFNQEVDTSKAAVELLRGTFKQNVTLKWADDKQSVQLIGAGNFPAADYTVKVSGLTEEPLTAELKIEAQKVVAINFLSDIAVASNAAVGGTFPSDTTATVGYEVLDQYGVDIAKVTELIVTPAGAEAEEGELTLNSALVVGKKVGDLVPVVLVHTATGVSAVKTLKLSDASTVASVAVKGIYNAKGEEIKLTDKTKDGTAYLVLDLKDQYGEDFLDDPAGKLIITNTNPTVAAIGTATKNKEVAGKFSVNAPIEVVKAGSTELIFIMAATGSSVRYTLNVAETTTTDAITVGQPEFAIVGEAVKIPLTVLDKEGNVITDRDLLSNKDKGIWVGTSGTPVAKKALEVKDGQVYYITDAPTAEGYLTYMFGTSTLKTGLVTFKVTAKAVPTAVRGFKKPLVLKADAELKIEWKHVNVDDQYGRTMTTTALSEASGYALKVAEIKEADTKAVWVDTNNKIIAKDKNGTAVVTLYLTMGGKQVANSAVEQTVRVTDGNEYSGYEIEDIGLVQANTEVKFTVNGLLNGGKVALVDWEYTAEIVGMYVVGNPFLIEDSELDQKYLPYPIDETVPLDTEFTLRVTINATGQVFDKKFTVSADEPEIEEFFFTKEKANYALAKPVTEALVANFDYAWQLKSNEEEPVQLFIATVDQYDNTAVQPIYDVISCDVIFDKIKIEPAVVGQLNIFGNGTSWPYAFLTGELTKANVRMTFELDNATVTIPVLVTKPDDTTAPKVVKAPVHDATNKTVTYTFSEPIILIKEGKPEEWFYQMESTLFKVYLVDKNGDYGEAESVEVTDIDWDAATNSMTFTYSDSKLSAGDYIVDAWGYKVSDIAGNVIANLADTDAANFVFTVSE